MNSRFLKLNKIFYIKYCLMVENKAIVGKIMFFWKKFMSPLISYIDFVREN